VIDVADRRFDRKLSRLIRELGERAMAELIREHCAQTMTRTSFETRLDECLARLTPETLELTGANQFATVPLHLVWEAPRR
jgi:hypothetical protein